MARSGSLLRRRRPPAGTLGRSERGATLSEYALLVSLVVVTSIGAIARLQDESGSYLVDTGSDIGTPRALAADINDDLPEAPAWLTQPPPPTTTTTAPTTTTTSTATTASTTATTSAATTATTAATTATTAAATTTTTAPTTTAGSYPTGGVIVEGAMSSRNNTDKCFQVESPGVAGASTSRHDCDGGVDQDLAAVGTSTVVALRFTDAPNNGLCLSASGTTIVMATCSGATDQLFNLTITNSGSGNRYVFASQASPTLCLTERSTGLELESCNGGDRQRYTFG